jgi:hypothetical protein
MSVVLQVWNCDYDDNDGDDGDDDENDSDDDDDDYDDDDNDFIMMMIMPVSLDGKHHHHNYHHHHYYYYYTGKVDLYVGKEVVRRAIPNEQACDELVSLIKEYGRWIDPRPVDEASPSSSSSKEETQVNA